MAFFLYIKCKIPRENMSPFLTCFPHLQFGKALRAGQHSARARKPTSPHYATRCVGAKKSERTRNFVLSSGAWHSLRGAIDFVAIAITRRRSSSKFRLRRSECLYKNPPHIQSAVKPRYLDEEREKALICRPPCTWRT